MNIRWMISRDLPSVMAIEEACFPNPWTKKELLARLKSRNTIGMVVEEKDIVMGFMIYELFPKYLFLHTFAVLPQSQKQGFGAFLIDRLILKLSNVKRNQLITYVRETNLAAQMFLQKKGFLATEILNDAYEDVDEAAYLMKYTVGFTKVVWKNRIGTYLQTGQ